MSSSILRNTLIRALPFVAALVIMLPFMNKAFTIDDTLFLLQAQNAVKDPLHPTAFDVVWSDDVWVRCSAIMPSGPVMAYLLVPTILSGGKEWVAHLTQLVFFMFGLAGVLRLARRFELSPIASAVAGLLVVASPCVVGMASTAMPDLPAMAFAVWGIDRILAFRSDEEHRVRNGLLAALCLALGALSRPHVTLMLGVAFLFLAKERVTAKVNRFEWRIQDVWPIAISLFFVVVVALIGRDPEAAKGNVAAATLALSNTGWAQWQRHLVAFFLHWSLATPIAFGVVLLLPTRINFVVVLATAIGSGAVLAGFGFRDNPWMAIPVGLSVASLLLIITTQRYGDTATKLGGAAWLLMAIPVVTYVHLPCKYILPSVPFAAIAVGQLFDEVRKQRPISAHAAMITVIIAGIFYGVFTLRADAIFAALGRRAAAELIAPRMAEGQRVWFFGRWGFQWYAMHTGAMILTKESHPSPGDILVGPGERYDSGPLIKKFPDVEAVESLTSLNSAFVMNNAVNAGFYSDWWGMLPSSPGDPDEIERFTVWRVKYKHTDP